MQSPAVESEFATSYIRNSQIRETEREMNQGPNRLFDEFAKLMTDAAGAAQGLRREAETAFRSQAERFLDRYGFGKAR